MDINFFLPLFLLLYFDVRLLKELDRTLFGHIFLQHWRNTLAVFGVIFLGMTLLGTGPAVFSYAIYFLLAIYLIRRRQFRKQYVPLLTNNSDEDFRRNLALNAFDLLWRWLLWMVVVVVTVQVIKEIFPNSISRLDELVSLAAASSIVMVILTLQLKKRLPGLKLKEAFGLKVAGISPLKLVILPIVFGVVFAILSSVAMYSRAEQPSTPLAEVLDATTSSWAIIFFVLTAILLAPFLEEIIFRGFFFYVLKECRGPVFAVVLISGIFGFLHMDQYWGDWLAISAVMILGIVLTLLRWWLGSSIPGMITHYFYNATMMLIPVLALLWQNPTYVQYQLNYARLTNPQKQELLLKSIKENPAHGPSYNDLAWLHAEEGKDLPEASQLIEQALSLEPNNAAFLDTKAEVLYKMGKYSEAVTIEQEVLKKFSDKEYAQKQLQKFEDALKKSNTRQSPPPQFRP